MKKPYLSVVLFFFLLFIGLFLGDGKQGVIEVFGGTVVLVLWGVRFLRGGSIAQLPKKLFFSWCGVFLVALISTIFSDSIGFSISWWVRLLSGYLIYRLLYDASSDEAVEVFVKGAMVFVFAASIFGAITYTSAWFRSILPSMNLFSLTYGHNHLADLLVFVAPLLFWIILKDQKLSWVKGTLFIGYCIMLFMTLARGAWVLVGAYSIYEYVMAKEMSDKKRMLKTAAIFLVIIFVGILTLFVSNNPIARERSVLRPQSVVSRLEYWRQAAEGLKERPIFGHGPGTFSLVSTRFQKIQGSASWFAHSEPLQIAAELGLVGVIAFMWLYFVHAQVFGRTRGQIKHFKISRVLITSVLLTLGYSLFEFTLDYFVLWLLFWATVGILTRKLFDGDSTKQYDENSIQISLVIVGIFYFLWVAGNVVTVVLKRHDVAFYVAPFDLVNTLAFLELSRQPPPNKMSLDLIKIFHRKNSATLFALGKLTNSSTKESNYYLENAMLTDPQNIEYLSRYIDTLLKQDNRNEIARVVMVDPTLSSFLTKELFFDVGKPPKKDEYFAKLYYFLGLVVLDKNPEQTRSLWSAARDMLPWWGHFHVELAGLYKDYLHDEDGANKILQECQAYDSSREECRRALDNGLAPVGSLVREIRQIPQKL